MSKEYSLTKANDIARDWLQKCDRKHATCKEARLPSQSKLPRRLISIGPPGSTTPILIETTSLGDTDCRYAALSHCWGTGQKPLQTTASTIENHYNLIQWESLPLTFQDAITVCQSLGLRYLWIDSLCVIQGDQKDFEEECSRMHLIYLGSYVMIAASDAKDGSEGFLPHGEHEDKSPDATELSALSSSSTQRKMWSEWSKLRKGPLSTRGWAFQESQLAPRIIYYTRLGILWECRVCFAAGDRPRMEPKGAFGRIERERVFRTTDISTARMNYNDIMHNWVSIAEEYSPKDLTLTRDRLPALSGLAAATESLLVAPYPIYLAGLFVPDICYQLFWTTLSPPERSPKSMFSDYPSWSWISHPGPINYHDVYWLLLHYAIYDVVPKDITHWVYSNSYASSDSYLARNLRDRLYPDENFSFLSTDIQTIGSNLFGMITGRALRLRGRYSVRHLSSEKTAYERMRVWLDYTSMLLNNVQLRFLFLLRDRSQLYGIVLKAVEDTTNSIAYEKIGVFYYNGSYTAFERNSVVGEMVLV